MSPHPPSGTISSIIHVVLLIYLQHTAPPASTVNHTTLSPQSLKIHFLIPITTPFPKRKKKQSPQFTNKPPPHSLFPTTHLPAHPPPFYQHKNNPLPFLPLGRRQHPHPHRRHPQHLGPPRRLGLQFGTPGPPVHHQHDPRRSGQMLRSQHVRAVFRAQVCAPRDGQVVREAELSECGG